MLQLPPSFIGSMAYSHPNFAIGDRELVHEEWLNDRHRVTAPFAFPERAHFLGAFPLRDRIPRIWIILIAKQPLTLQPFRFSTNFKNFLEGCLEIIPLPRQNFAPNDPYVHFAASPVRALRHMTLVSIRYLPVHQLTGLSARD